MLLWFIVKDSNHLYFDNKNFYREELNEECIAKTARGEVFTYVYV
jgi:hypothetical protein